MITGARSADKLERPCTPELQDLLVGGEFHITKDPDNTWSCDSSFRRPEIEQLLYMEYLTEGTEFRREPSKVATHRVKFKKFLYYLKPLVPGEERILPLPYWKQRTNDREAAAEQSQSDAKRSA